MLKLAQPHHIPDLQRFAKSFFQASPYHPYGLDETKMNSLILKLMNAKMDEATVIVYEVNGRVVGCIAGQTSQILFNDERIASEIMWWVEPEYRKTKAGLNLLKAFESWAVFSGCKIAHMVCLNDKNGVSLDKLYSRLGYEQTERHYMKAI